MALTRIPGVTGLHTPIICDDELKTMPARSPGTLGLKDAGDVTKGSQPGDTAGPAGTNGDLGWSLAHSDFKLDLHLGRWAAQLSATKQPGGTGQSEFDRFKAKVLAEEIAMRTRRGLKRLAAVPESELEIVEGDKRMRKEAAAKLKQLLAKARADLKADQDEFAKLGMLHQKAARAAAAASGEVVATDVKGIWVQSAYRDFAYDEKLWHSYFKDNYYPATKEERAKLPGGEHGAAAVRYLAEFISPKKAPPGFSNHSDGRAVDFGTQEGHIKLVGRVSQNPRWKKAWLHRWLVKHAPDYGFKALKSEAWHWDFGN